jgi:pyruvate carboxylase subunit B
MAIAITDTTLRDAHQSLVATRMRTADMLPIAEKLDRVGFFSLEAWGGATFDSCIRYLNEDPWDRLQELRRKVKNTRLQMLLRGQNLVGYRHYADDVVREFVRLAVKNGVDVFRIFDALNDIRNMRMAIEVAKEYRAHVQGTVCYTTSPVHSVEDFAALAVELERLGCDSICIKDMAGLISPKAAGDLVQAIKARVKIPLNLHSHCSSGMAPLSYYAAALAGVDILDTAFSAFSWGTSQPPTEGTVAALKDTPYDTGLDLELLYEIGEDVAAMSDRYRSLCSPETLRPNISVLVHQIPGGMLSNLVSQLKGQNALDRLGEVLNEVPRVRADLGYPPLVTPTSQIVGTQAVLNVLSGAQYSTVTREVKSYFLGQYGRPQGKLNEEVKKRVIGGEQPVEVRPADMIPPELEKMRDEANKEGILRREEDLITYALYPQIAVKFLRGEVREEHLPVAAGVAGADRAAQAKDTAVRPAAEPARRAGVGESAVVSPMPGVIIDVKVKVGDVVSAGDVVAILEAMKMENEIRSSHAGVVKQIMLREGDLAKTGTAIMFLDRNGNRR